MRLLMATSMGNPAAPGMFLAKSAHALSASFTRLSRMPCCMGERAVSSSMTTVVSMTWTT